MNPFEELITQTTENEMTRSRSFDLSNSGSSLFQQHTQISSVSNAIGHDPSRLSNFLGHHPLNNNSAQKLETIYENAPISSNFHWNQNTDEQLSDKKNISVRGSVSSWNL